MAVTLSPIESALVRQSSESLGSHPLARAAVRVTAAAAVARAVKRRRRSTAMGSVPSGGDALAFTAKIPRHESSALSVSAVYDPVPRLP
jgi:hypothetical protein